MPKREWNLNLSKTGSVADRVIALLFAVVITSGLGLNAFIEYGLLAAFVYVSVFGSFFTMLYYFSFPSKSELSFVWLSTLVIMIIWCFVGVLRQDFLPYVIASGYILSLIFIGCLLNKYWPAAQ